MSSQGQIGTATFALTLFISHFLMGPQTCSDGWQSPSIGRPGACSWHGGVNHTPQFIAVAVSAVLALIAYCIAYASEQKRLQQVQQMLRSGSTPNADEAAQEGMPCPLCGYAMKKRLARKRT